jgi:hypothetical protein
LGEHGEVMLLFDRISQSSETQTSEYVKKLGRGPIVTIGTYQGYDINGYMFYTEQQDEKIMYQNSGVHVDAYDVMGQDKNMYCGQIQEILELDFHSFKIPLFPYNWVDAIEGVVQDKYKFISVELNHQGYKLEPFMLANHVVQVFYVPDTTLLWLYLENNESSESRMPSMRKSSINLMRFLLSSPR